jgi:minor histocompatibility antigen H13
MRIWDHGQPALLYLVPGVLGTLWGTALVRGEWKLMWEYTEDGSLDVEGDGEKNSEKKGLNKEKEGLFMGLLGSGMDEKVDKILAKAKEEHAHHVFLFSLSEPKLRKAKVIEKSE